MLDTYITIVMYFLTFGLVGWALSLYLKNVTHVDSMWALFPLLGSVVCIQKFPLNSIELIFSFFIILWSLRLFLYLTKRNWGKQEDKRYQVIRQNNEPFFKYKSLYIIFWLQAMMASVLMISIIGISIAFFGLAYEAIADWQLSRFLKNNKNQVMDQGLWYHSRHPNYFGEFLV